MRDIGLLLARADTQDAILAGGLDWQAAAEGDAPTKREGAWGRVICGDRGIPDRDDLEVQRWGVVVPEGAKGKRLREVIAELVEHRKGEQAGNEPRIYELPLNMTAEQSWGWWRDVYHDPSVRQADQPGYALILGGPELISWEFQTTVGRQLCLGRLAFPDDAGYEAYVAKVLEHEKAPPAPASSARALFHAVRDGTDATTAGERELVLPALLTARENAQRHRFASSNIVVLGGESQGVSMDDFLAAAAHPIPTMAFTVSHGIGAGRRGWKTVAEQHREQGAMCFGKGLKLTHELVEKQPFFPGGVWFFHASLGAGTPSSSSYARWLKKLQETGAFGSVEEVLEALPAPGQAPFMARLPQAALANPNGPVSIVGHVDLAWTTGFQDHEVVQDPWTKQATLQSRGRSGRFDDIFRRLVAGGRTGAACTSLDTMFDNADGELTSMFDAEEKDRSRGTLTRADLAREHRKASLWMLRQDAVAHVTLGDPAARLNVAKPEPVVRRPRAASPAAALGGSAPAAAPSAGTVKKLAISRMEAAILPILTEDITVKKVAEKLGMERQDVQAWADAYQAAGRAALENL